MFQVYLLIIISCSEAWRPPQQIWNEGHFIILFILCEDVNPDEQDRDKLARFAAMYKGIEDLHNVSDYTPVVIVFDANYLL